MLPLAHFTVSELPGTAAIWVAGIGLGVALTTRGLRGAAPPLALIAVLASLSMLGDAGGWPQPVKVAIEAAFLVAAVVLALSLRPRREVSRLRRRDAPPAA